MLDLSSGKHGHSILLAIPVSDTFKTWSTHWTWLHVSQLFFYFKLSDKAGTWQRHGRDMGYVGKIKKKMEKKKRFVSISILSFIIIIFKIEFNEKKQR